jgi:hypothetical protein
VQWHGETQSQYDYSNPLFLAQRCLVARPFKAIFLIFLNAKVGGTQSKDFNQSPCFSWIMR